MNFCNALIRSFVLFLQGKNDLPQSLILYVTSRCNARCDFCLYVHRRNGFADEVDEMNVHEFDKIAASYYGRVHYLALAGGEPFIRKDIPEIVQCFVDCCKTSIVDIPSNFFFTDNLLNACTKLAQTNPHVVFDIQLSLDHLYEKHDRIRGLEGLFARAMDTYMLLKKLCEEFGNIRLKVNVVYQDANKADLSEIYDFIARKLQPHRCFLTYPQKVICPKAQKNETNLDDTANDVAHFFKMAGKFNKYSTSKSKAYSWSMRLVREIAQQLMRLAIDRRSLMNEFCNAGKSIVVVGENGEVYPCEILWESIGNLRNNNYDISSLLRGDRYKQFAARYLSGTYCNCSWLCAVMSTLASDKTAIIARS